MPVFKRNGNIISFAACREHVSLYVGEQALAAFKEKTGDYNTNKSALYLPYGKPLPLKLIKDLAKWCLA